jgi:hypothetical protein
MTTDSADDTPRVPRRRESLDEQARRKGVRPVERLEDMARDVFSSDEELEEFIAYTYANRRDGLA